jgi:Helix-turn-helix domain
VHLNNLRGAAQTVGRSSMKDHSDLSGWLTVEQTARLAGVSPQAVYSWICRGRLRPCPTVDGYRIDADDLFRLLSARRAAAVAGVGMGTVLRWAGDETAEVAR